VKLLASANLLDPRGPAAARIASAWWLMFGLAAAVYVVVAGLIVAAALRGRSGEAGRAPRISDGSFIWVGGIVVPTLILLVLAVVTVTTTNALRAPQRRELQVEVVGHDWWWAVRYPGTDVATANDIHVPVGRAVAVGLRSDDVIHSFWAPRLAGKMDLIPGQRNVLRFRADRPGAYLGECAEFCGLQHANMRFYVIAEAPADFGRWLARQQALRGEPESEEAARGQQLFMANACAGCHTIRGTGAAGRIGPDLTDIGGRRSLGAGAVANTRANLEAWITDPHSLKPGALMPPFRFTDADLRAIAVYLEGQR
jgi:cytochrome c oxidase subunit 2